MKHNLSLVVALSLFMSVQPSIAFSRGGDSPLLSRTKMDRDADRAASAPEIVAYEGEVRCKNECTNSNESRSGDGCELEFIRDDGKAFKLSGSPALLKAHCLNHAENLRVTLTGEQNPKFLFWGGDIVVKNFEIVSKVASNHDCNRSPAEVAPKQSSPREYGPRGKAAI